MNYMYQYFKLICNRLEHPLKKEQSVYLEKHHIIPLSEHGQDTQENQVYLTLREHYIAHLLLWKIYNDYAMAKAVNCFQTGICSARPSLRKFNSRLFQKARILAKEGNRGKNHPFYGKHHTTESKKKMSKNCAMRRPEVRAKISGDNCPSKRLDVRKKISESKTKWTHETTKEESLKYPSRTAFKRRSHGAYCSAKKHGWLDEFFPKKSSQT